MSKQLKGREEQGNLIAQMKGSVRMRTVEEVKEWRKFRKLTFTLVH